MPELLDVAPIAALANLRLQAIVRASSASAAGQPGAGELGPGEPGAGELGTGVTDQRLVICYRPPAAGAEERTGMLVRSERIVPALSLAETAAELLAGTSEASPAPTASETVVDLLVCTHGRRDMCCGGRGMDLIGALVDDFAIEPPGLVRLWRTSHTGGHRFAPTCIVLPSATMWAWADPRLVRGVVARDGAVTDVLGRYRGYACLGSPPEQAVERAVLAQVGWSLLERPRRAHSLGGGRVRLETDGAGTWEATAREGRRVPQPDCRSDPGAASKFGVEWVVEGLRQVAPV